MIREERSDGTVAVTVAYGEQAGLEIGAGAHLFEVALGRGKLGFGGELTAAAVAVRERGYTWVLRDRPRRRRAHGTAWGWGRGRSTPSSRADGFPRPTQRYRHGGLAEPELGERPHRCARDARSVVAGRRGRHAP